MAPIERTTSGSSTPRPHLLSRRPSGFFQKAINTAKCSSAVSAASSSPASTRASSMSVSPVSPPMSMSATPGSESEVGRVALSAAAELAAAAEGLRFFVWRAGDWHPVSEMLAAQIKAHLKVGEWIFTVREGPYRWRIETAAEDGWVQVNTESGRRRKMKFECINQRGARRIRPFETATSLISAARRLGESVLPGKQARKPTASTLQGPSRMPSSLGDGGLLGALRQEWRVMSGGRKTMTRVGMARAWRVASGCAGGGGSDEEAELLTQTAEDIFNKVDLSRNSKIEQAEWLHYRLLEIHAPSFHALAEVNELLLEALKADDTALERLLKLFESSLQEEGACYSCVLSAEAMRKAADVWSRDVSKTSGGEGRPGQRTRELVAMVDPSVTDMDEHEALTYYDFMNRVLGRKKAEVFLYLYDLSHGRASWWAPLLLGQEMEGVWHSAVVVHGKEYWYGGRVLESPPGSTQFGRPTRIIRLGETMRTKDDLVHFVRRELLDEFTTQTYDVLINNCNHFSNEVCKFLTNGGIPEEVLRQPEVVQKSIVFQAIRPALNWSLGCFGDESEQPVTAKFGAAGGLSAGTSSPVGGVAVGKARAFCGRWSEIVEGQLVAYEFELGWTRIARIVEKSRDTCSVQWYDSRVGRLQLQHGVDRSAVLPLQRSGAKTKNRPGGGGIFGACYHSVDIL
mmetsp:Transcript_82441/g.236942  ORF Transcript_82441/g.236942 Transcript_82441/m.236942 type:complete len:684 (-) Transcript_82441:221-2272(-)